MGIYLDYNSSTPIDKRVLDVMVNVYKNTYGNSDSRTHDYGDGARKIVEDARSNVASILSINKDEVFFTSGATESINIALLGLKSYAIKENKRHIITTSIEHKAVIETAKSMKKEGFEVDFIDPDESGRILPEQVKQLLREDTLLVSVMHVNNETGIIQPIKEIGEFLADKPAFFHVDATQSFGKLVEELREVKYNMLSMSAHKLGGPQGIGALVLKKQGYHMFPVKSIVYGGQQEHGIRPGTVPVALVAGLGAACEFAEREYKQNEIKCAIIKEKLIELLKKSELTYEYNGNQDYCVSSTMNICINGVASEALMLSSKQFCAVSNGSACNSKSYRPSYVLTAMGLPIEKIENSIRISWGPHLDLNEVEELFTNMTKIAKGLVF